MSYVFVELEAPARRNSFLSRALGKWHRANPSQPPARLGSSLVFMRVPGKWGGGEGWRERDILGEQSRYLVESTRPVISIDAQNRQIEPPTNSPRSHDKATSYSRAASVIASQTEGGPERGA
jgi:hypothetical protein